MPKGFIEKETLTSIADAIREKSGGEETYLPSQMAEAIKAIPSGGDFTLEDLKLVSTLSKNSYWVAEEIDPAGLIVGAEYSKSDADNIATFNISSNLNFEPKTVAEDTQEVTVHYKDKSIGAHITNFGVEPQYGDWTWGDPTEIGDETWWLGLQEWVNQASNEELEALLGQTKKVSLSTRVLGADAATMQVVGWNCDGEHTLTFQSKYILPTGIAINPGSVGADGVYYEGSKAETECKNFAEYCSASKAIKEVTLEQFKGDSSVAPGRNNPVDSYIVAKVFLPSMAQMGLPGTASSGSSASNEYTVANTEKKAWQLYVDSTSREKHKGTADGEDRPGTSGVGLWYWTRSRYYSTSDGVCYVHDSGTAGNLDYDYTGGTGLAPVFVIG